MLGLHPRFVLPPLSALVIVALGLLLEQAWIGLAVAAVVSVAVAMLLAAHMHTRLLAIRATVVSGLVRPRTPEPADEIDGLADAVARFVNSSALRQRDDRDELEHQTLLLDRMNDGL